MKGVFTCVFALSILKDRPGMGEVISFVNWEAIILVGSMSKKYINLVIVFGIMKTTGIFEFLGIKAYKLSKGSVWRLAVILGSFCFFISLILDNVTLMLLMVPVTIQIAKVMGIDPVPLLIIECIFG
jgi:Na+/H+ antiporter NhaD/arsenite permease-like protein